MTIGASGWDPRSANFTALQNHLLPPVDQAQASRLTDLDKQGMLDDTIVLYDLAATIFHALGVAPHHEARAATGRPMPLFRERAVIHGLLG